MQRILFLIVVLFCFSCSHTYYVVRHAEKADADGSMMTSDVPLTGAGENRAQRIMQLLKNKKIGEVYSTNTIRTKSTAKPTADYFGLPIQMYGPRPDSAFIQLLKSKKKNILVVGHSNTVDDIVNGLCNEKKVAGDLDDSEYNKLFVVRFKGKKVIFEEKNIFP